MRSKNATSVLCSPLQQAMFLACFWLNNLTRNVGFQEKEVVAFGYFCFTPFAFVKFYQVNLLSFPISSFLLRFSSSKTFKFPKLFQFVAAAIQDFYLNFWRKKVFDGFWTDQMNIVQTFDIVRLYRKSSSRSFFCHFRFEAEPDSRDPAILVTVTCGGILILAALRDGV